MINRYQFWPRPLVTICRWGIWCGGAVALLSAFLVTTDVLVRSITMFSPFNSFELGSYGFAISLGLSLPYSFMAGAHIRIDLAAKVKSRAFHLVADLAAIASMSAFAAIIAYFGVAVLLDSIKYGARSNSTLALPLAIPQALWVAGLVVFALVTFYALGRGVIWACRRQTVTLLSAARLNDDEDVGDRGRES